MSDTISVSIDLEAVRRRLSNEFGQIPSPTELEDLLGSLGFVRSGEKWLTDNESVVNLLQDEIFDVESLDDLKIQPEAEEEVLPGNIRGASAEELPVEKQNDGKNCDGQPLIATPTFLYGLLPYVSSASRRAVQLLVTKGWDEMYEFGSPVIEVPESAEIPSFHRPVPAHRRQPDSALYVTEFFSLWEKAIEKRQEIGRPLPEPAIVTTTRGLDHLWFTLCFLGVRGNYLPYTTEGERPVVRGACEGWLKKINRWWPTITRLSPRFHVGYNRGYEASIGVGRIFWMLRVCGFEEHTRRFAPPHFPYSEIGQLLQQFAE